MYNLITDDIPTSPIFKLAKMALGKMGCIARVKSVYKLYKLHIITGEVGGFGQSKFDLRYNEVSGEFRLSMNGNKSINVSNLELFKELQKHKNKA